jgi:ADP-ribose pyrophosphatase YjhB (NUDIX family)
MSSSAQDQTPYYRFCPRCGGALATRVVKPGDIPRLVCTGCDFVFYLDPKLAVGTIITDESGRVLLIRRALEPGYGRWVFPGGFVERAELVEDAARREAREESGLEVRLDRLVGVYSYTGRVPVVLVYAATPTSGTLDWRDEGLEARFFTALEIPWDELAFRSTREALQRFFAR